MSIDKAPDFQDEVKHKFNDTTGTVIAIYTVDGVEYVDVRSDNRVYYSSPAANWEVTVVYEE